MKKVLVANRGEIACRIIRALKELSIKSVAIYSMVDKNSLHVKYADEAVCIGNSSAQESYLNISRIIAAAEITGADAIHPGYGFLSENALFAEIVESSGLVFIGPSSFLIKSLGDKIQAKNFAKSLSCPVIPGTENKVETLSDGLKEAKKIKYPLMIKSSAGGGGRGIKVAFNEQEFINLYPLSKKEALACFGDDSIFLEKKIKNPKHIEVQIAADKFGNVVHFYERDCSLQRRAQKLIEETLSPSLDEKKREEICNAAVNLVKKAGYYSLCTVEFLLDGDGNFYFMEINTRIQVEHTVTEELTGYDLVVLQIEIAMGKKLSMDQKDIKAKGHVMEFRINAEDPKNGFKPSPGVLNVYIPPFGKDLRIDSSLYSGGIISPYYDSMVAKLIVKGNTREQVIIRSCAILKEFIIEGVCTTISFYLWLLNTEEFQKNQHHISFVDIMIEQGECFVE
jgi:acetyl-CoA carboxylase biotin carboxylase subunit